jgi:antitoxin component YwqK of YwqJK toxin-antitoxin module
MRFFYILTFLFITVFSLAQEKVSSSELYTTKGITYRESDNSVFTGINEFRKSNGHLVFEREYINGYLVKYTLYYNGEEKIVSSETIYQNKSNIKKKHISYPYHDTLMTVTDFDENGKKMLEEQYVNDKLVYHCEYLNGKKHGAIFSIDKNNIKNTCHYINGKRISSSKETATVR